MTTARNDFTGDMLMTKPSNQKYRDNWDRIFGDKKKEEETKKQKTKKEK